MVEGESVCGLIGVILFCPFLFASIYHTILAHHRLQNIMNPKVLFYASLSSYSVLEFIYFAGLFYYNRSTKWTYCLHMIALIFFVYAFSIVIYLWGSTMSFGKQFQAPYYAGVVVVGLNLIVTILGVIFLCLSHSFWTYQDDYWYINLTTTLMHSICLMLLSVSMLFYGIQLQLKLARSTVKSAPGKTTKSSIILRINGMLTICTVCFFLRVIVLGILCSDIILQTTYTDKQITSIAWYMMSNWIPTLIPATTLLVMLRVKASPSSSKHIRTEDGSWRETDITTDSKRATVRRQNFASENESFSQFEDGVNPVHRTSPMSPVSEGSLHIQTKSVDMDYDDDEYYGK